MRLTFIKPIAVGSLLWLMGCHMKEVKVQPPAIPAPKSYVIALENADRFYAEAKYESATNAYDEYLRDEPTGLCQNRDHALFRKAVINSLPENAKRNSAQTVALLKEIANCSNSSLKPAAQLYLGLYDNIDELSAQKEEQNRKVQQLQSKMDELNAQAAEDAPVALAAGDCVKDIPEKEKALPTTRADRRDQILFELGVYYNLPTCQKRNPDKSAMYLKQISEKSPYYLSAKAMLSMNTQIAQLSAEMEKETQKSKDLSTQLERLKDVDKRRPRR